LLLEVGVEPERVLEARDVTAGSGIAVPEPRAADAGTLLEHEDAQALLAQHLQRVQPAHPRADDDHVRVKEHGGTLRGSPGSQARPGPGGAYWRAMTQLLDPDLFLPEPKPATVNYTVSS